MKTNSRPLFHINITDWIWWAWTVTTALLIVGLSGLPLGFIAAMALTVAQLAILLLRDRDPVSFSVQLRGAYLLLLGISYPRDMRWLYWLPTVGTLALVVFGYCLMVRILSLLPWHNREAYTLSRLRRTFFSAPDLHRSKNIRAGTSYTGGLCTLEAQIAPSGEAEERSTPLNAETSG